MENQKSFYITLESDLIFDNRINSTTKIIYSIISTYSNNSAGYCFLNHKQLAKIMKITERQFYRAVLELKKYNYITVKKHNNRSYLMPVINTLPELRKNNTTNSEIFDYDWLNSNKEN